MLIIEGGSWLDESVGQNIGGSSRLGPTKSTTDAYMRWCGVRGRLADLGQYCGMIIVRALLCR